MNVSVLFSDDLLEQILDESNLYAQHADITKPLNLDILIYMSADEQLRSTKVAHSQTAFTN